MQGKAGQIMQGNTNAGQGQKKKRDRADFDGDLPISHFQKPIH
jgi:hypothetical protein